MLGKIKDDSESGPVLKMITSTMQLGAKLAGALDGIAHGVEPEPGFVVALLKRSLPYMNEALAEVEPVEVVFARVVPIK